MHGHEIQTEFTSIPSRFHHLGVLHDHVQRTLVLICALFGRTRLQLIAEGYGHNQPRNVLAFAYRYRLTASGQCNS